MDHKKLKKIQLKDLIPNVLAANGLNRRWVEIRIDTIHSRDPTYQGSISGHQRGYSVGATDRKYKCYSGLLRNDVKYQGPLDSRTTTRTSTRFDWPFLVKILRKFTTRTINLTLC